VGRAEARRSRDRRLPESLILALPSDLHTQASDHLMKATRPFDADAGASACAGCADERSSVH